MQKNSKLIIYINPVFELLSAIPRGSVVTYGAVAKSCGIANARNVSWILRQNTEPDRIPCYKVIRSDGSLASGYKFGGPKEQQRRLTAEGVIFTDNGKVAMEYFIQP